jgi:SSS family solute:Na+ symporter
VHFADWVCIGLYSALLFGISAYHARKLKRQDDVFLAGRSMSRWPIAISMYMALFSTNSFLGITGWVNRPNGTVWIALQSIGIILAVPLVVWLYPALFYRLGITSAYEYLERRYDGSVRTIATLFFLLARLMWMSTIVYSASLVVSTMLGFNETANETGQLWAICGIGALAATFALMGGMHAVIWTDVMQFFVLLSGLITMMVIGVQRSGGMSHIVQTGIDFDRFRMPPAFSLTAELSIAGGLLLGFAGMLSSAGADQVVLQQYLTANSEREAKASLWRNGFFLKPMSFIYPFLGLVMFVYYRNAPEVARLMRIPDDALPVFIMNVLPTGARGLMTVAIIAAVLTSVQSGLAAVSAAVQVNFVRRSIDRPLSDGESVRLARVLLLAAGVCTVALACFIRQLGQQNSIIQILNIVMYPFSGVLLGIFLLGILSHRANARGVFTGAIVAIACTAGIPLARFVVPESVQASWLHTLLSISNFYYGFVASVLTCVLGYGVSLLFPPPADSKIRGLTHWNMPEPVDHPLPAEGAKNAVAT